MDVLWYAVLVLLLTGYFATEGFTIGVGMLLPVLGRDQDGRDRLVASVAPFVLAGEVWLVAVAGALFGAFPTLEGEVLFALYPLVVGLLTAWILRDAGLWFRRRVDGTGWRAFWDGVLCLGSWGLAVVWGLALATLAGLPGGPVLGVAAVLVVAGAFAFHGWTFTGWRLPGEITRARRGGAALWGSAALAAAPAAVLLLIMAPQVLQHAAPSGTLNVLTLTVAPFVPLGVAAQVWVWRTFGRRGSAAPRTPSFF
ncbi:cytochrome d ubiquinol oxidase subunit II [Thermostaphylospora chromogena]|uniref:Cytochrome bd-I ubiquinol oxidase subunit 2 apoprotein n=1 Tax=Thermostaphylospora chromogena TaxID=35622 RepID=A0A1H1GM93_9ACTN|nr:cytochrome d ubiquinol oxidase subunit II [Thermostaphylospora chromogena]SDR14213.1 cytochrome bd-I ubiquinol oxidase subunit 2 apoprotein [Thermostaphylospora chromogena]